MPAMKKKIASSPSAAQSPRVRSRCSQSGPSAVSVPQNDRYESSARFPQSSATAVAASRNFPPVVS
jgi:hypothetical protein